LEDASVPLCGALQLIGQWQMRQRRFDAATRYFQQWVEIARSAGGARPNAKQRRSLAVALENLGDALREAGRHDEALQAYREAIGTGMHPERCKDWSPASVWAKIAKVHKSREHWSEALEAETACLEASRAEGDTSSACSAASRIGDLYAKRGDPAAGIEWKRCAVAIARGGDARWDVSGHLFHAGWWDLPIAIDELITALREAGRHHEAIEIDLKLRCCDVAIAREGGDRRHVALSLERLGDALRKAGRHDEAIEAYREAIETGMHPTRCEQWSPSRAWIEIANLQTAREDWSKAIETETADLEASRAEGDTGNACRAASRIGSLHAKLGDPAAGIEWQRRAVAIARGSDDRRVVALSLKWLGDALREAGRHDEALKAYREAIDTGMNPTRCEKWSPASVWIDIAKVHKSRQAWSELIEAETACLEGHLEDGDTGNACLVAIRIGTLHAKLGDPAAGIEWQRCAVAIARGSDDRRVVVRSLERLGDALREAGRHDEAIEAYREAIETGMHPERCAEWSPASVWATIAEVHEARKDWSEAIEAATAEFEVRLEDGCPITCRIAAHIGDLHAKRGDPAAGIEWQRRAVAIAQGSHEAWESLEWLGDALRDSGRYDEAIEAYREAIEACERLAAHPLHVERVERLRARIAAMNQ
jgi:tetratricopeptide (TPR) repeat protein